MISAMKLLRPWPPALIVTLVLLTLGPLGSATDGAMPSGAPKKSFNVRPRLFVTLVIDQFRSDTLPKFHDRLLPARDSQGRAGGFRYLIEKGAYFPYSQHDLIQAMTGPGHASVLTGSLPYLNQIVANDWYDDIKQDRMYCVEDSSHQLIGAVKEKPHAGTSPKNLQGSTVGDELKAAGYEPSKVISIALKDRAAILMGGHRADAAIWMDKSGKKWISSTFYFPDKQLPQWVQKENEKLSKTEGDAFTWKAQGPGSGLSLKDPMVLKDAWNQRIGLQFPHALKKSTPEALSSPWGVEATLELALAALNSQKLGQDKITDILAVSFSTHDYIAHAFGPNSREAEEIFVAEDLAIARLIRAIEEKVPGGLNEVTFALTADHGGPQNPDWLASQRMPAGRIDEAKLTEQLEAHLVDAFGKPKGADRWIAYGVDFGWHLNPRALEKSGRPLEELEERLRARLLKEQGTLDVVTSTDVRLGRLAGRHHRQAKNTWVFGKSPDVLMIPRANFMPTGDTVTHLTGHAYDTTVPLVLTGKGVQAGTFASPARVVDLAPTASWLLGITPPALSEGRVLEEALK